jgi:hypothetical protein
MEESTIVVNLSAYVASGVASEIISKETYTTLVTSSAYLPLSH